MRNLVVSSAATLIFTTTSAFAAPPIYMDMEGTKQGRLKAETPKGIAVQKLIYEVKSPRDIATGQATGKRQHGPVCITKELSVNSPQLFQATVTNEVMKTVNFRYLKTNPNGEEYAYFTLKLTNATLSTYKQMSGYADSQAVSGAKTQAAPGSANLEEICLTFQRIEMQSTDGKTMAMDDWFAAR